jgi:diacylglycerol kinase family enzyme
MPRAAFVVNDRRARDPARLHARLARAALAAGWDPLVLATSATDPGGGMTGVALAAGSALVFAVGGDGTVRACADVLAGTGVPLAILPLGSANLTAHALGIPARLTAAVAVGLHGRVTRIDMATADGLTYLAMAGMGLDATVVGGTPDALRRATGWLAYGAAAVRFLAGPPSSYTIVLDGETKLTREARSVVVGNVGLLPGGFTLLPDARLDDGILDVAVLAPAGPADWAVVGSRVLLHSRPGDRRLERYQARQVEISADAELARQVDGEVLRPASTLSVQVRPAALQVKVPS